RHAVHARRARLHRFPKAVARRTSGTPPRARNASLGPRQRVARVPRAGEARDGSAQRLDQGCVRKAGGGQAPACLPFTDRATGLVAGQAIGTADVMAEVLEAALHGRYVRAVEAVELAPTSRKPPVAIHDAVGGMANEERIEVALVVGLEHVE